MGLIEAVYIFNERKYSKPFRPHRRNLPADFIYSNAIVTHTFTARPPPASTLLPLYLAHAEPRPSCIYLSGINPPTLLFSMLQDGLLFTSPCSTDTEPLVVLEFLHRVADALEEFLGAPLLASKLEANYDVIAQVLSEMCDGGLIGGTEANALRDVVDTPSWMGKLLGGVGLPGTSPALNAGPTPFSGLGSGGSGSLTPTLSTAGSQIPWRRSNVRHTSNEMYVDIVETLSVTYAPSGRPLAAFANGSIAFTSKVSGVPDLLLSLRAGSGPGADKVKRTMERPVFHPCVRLARWRDHAELSFVPPDGRFVLAGYDVDLLDPSASPLSAKAQDLNLPASIEIRTGLGATGSDFEVRLTVSHRFYTGSGSSGVSLGTGSAAATSLSNNLGAPRPSALRGNSGEAKAPLLEDLTVSIPITTAVRNISDLRATKGEAHWSPGDASIEWKISAKEAAGISSAGCVLRCSVVGAPSDDDEDETPFSNGMKSNTHDYNDDENDYQTTTPKHNDTNSAARDKKKARQNAILMPGSASLSFGVKGWLASGLKVDSLVIDSKRSKGLGEGVRPYKGVKYLTVSRKGVEVRC
ncbi:clathrin adaptor, mu subunit [Aureobasidium sp. EXF-12298]|nr:clathrin adaptor, mu subunit [Aureobasidium sp. EXF-12298]KAI4766671.1 clathrin adaptor, mu subunit [Aureobasidium sp. EXF-12344]KAI4784595.1 clathrin adaptor, mu subunit [Aureobasidium sp. EXF-3400]